MKTTQAVIQTQDLTKHFKEITAVDRVNFEVVRGEVFGFLGPNGAGKTTTIAMLLGLVRPSSGSAEVLGHDIRRDLNTALRRVGSMVETPSFYPYMSGEDNLRLLARIISREAELQVPTVLDRVGLQGRGRDRVSTYSLGMRQRLGLAAALLGDPELLILDEPTNGLDPAGMQEMRSFIRQLVEEENRTIFISSHLLHEVEQTCDRVLILNKGQVIAQGEVKSLLNQTQAIEICITDAGPAARVLSSIDWVTKVEGEGDCLRVDAPPERAPELLAALAARNLFPYQVQPIAATLESVFLKLTEQDSLDAADDLG